MKHIRVHCKFQKPGKRGWRRGVLWYYWPQGQWHTRRSRPGPRTCANPTAKQMQYWNQELAIMAHQWELELNDRDQEAVIHMPVVTACQRFCLWAPVKYGKGTVIRMDKNLRRFSAWVREYYGNRNINGIRTNKYALFRDYLLSTGLAPATVNCSLYDVVALCKWCMGESYVTQNYAKLVNMCPVDNDDDGPLAMEGDDAFWEVIGSMKTDFRVATVGLLATTGMRLGELQMLKWDTSWDYYTGALTIGAEQKDTRNKKHIRMLPVNDLARHYLMMLKIMQGDNHGPYVVGVTRGHDMLTSQINKWLRPLGLCPKNLRQWCRSSLIKVLRLGGSMIGNYLVNDYMGHMMSRTRRAYERLRDYESLRPLATRLNDWLTAARPTGIVPMESDEAMHEARFQKDYGIPDEEF